MFGEPPKVRPQRGALFWGGWRCGQDVVGAQWMPSLACRNSCRLELIRRRMVPIYCGARASYSSSVNRRRHSGRVIDRIIV